MRRKLFSVVLLFGTITCVMGADTIVYNAGQPVANPGGAGGTVEAKGTFAVDPGNNFGSVTFWTKQAGAKNATAQTTNVAAPNWDSTPKTLAAANYDVWGELVTWDRTNLKFVFTQTATVNLNVK